MPPTLAHKVKRSQQEQAVVDALFDNALFHDWPSDMIDRLAPYMRLEELTPGQTIFEEGDDGKFVGIVASGRLAVDKFNSADERVPLANLHPGRVFGEMALLDGERRSATVTAAELSTVLVLGAESMTQMSAKEPAVALAFYKKLAHNLSKRLRSADGRLVG